MDVSILGATRCAAFCSLGLIAAFLLIVALPSHGAENSLLGRHVENFSLKDFRGQDHALDNAADQKFIVLAFIGTECPLAKLYAPRLAQLAADYEPKGVAFFGIDSNQQDSITELAAYARHHGVNFPLLKDLGNEVADQIGAARTPEVFVLDVDRNIRYCGRDRRSIRLRAIRCRLSARQAQAERLGRSARRVAGQ